MNLQTERKLKMNITEEVLNVLKCCFFNDGMNYLKSIPKKIKKLLKNILIILHV